MSQKKQKPQALPAISITQPIKIKKKLIQQNQQGEAYPVNEQTVQCQGSVTKYGFVMYKKQLENTSTESTLKEKSQKQTGQLSDLVHLSTTRPKTNHLLSSKEIRQFQQNFFMLPLYGANIIYTREELFLSKKFERMIKITTQQIINTQKEFNISYFTNRTKFLEEQSFYTQFFKQQVQNIVIFNGAYPTFRDEFAKRGYLINTDLQSENFNIKFVVKVIDAKWDNLYPFQYLNHIQGMIYITTKGQLVQTLKNEVDLDSHEYFPMAYRVITDASGLGKIKQGNNDETQDFLDHYVYLEACKRINIFIQDVFAKKLITPEINNQEKIVEKEVELDDEAKTTILINSQIEIDYLSSQLQLLESMHILRYYLQNRIIDEFPIKLNSIDAVNDSEILTLIPDYPLQYPVGLKKHEIINKIKGRTYLEKLKNSSLNVVVDECQLLLSQFQKNSKQSILNDFNNVWICKPSGKSRGRGIFASDNLKQLLTLDCDQIEELPEEDLIDKDDKYIIQKYVERPFIINEYKFDIRQWVLVSSVNPLIVWQWTKPYLRFCSAKYSNSDLNNPFIHLSNNSVQKYADSFGSNIDGNMWHFTQMCEYIETHYDLSANKHLLQSKYDTSIEFPNVGDRIMYDMARIIISTLQAARFKFGEHNGFELFGYDFILDIDLQVWCLEINTSPTMEFSTDLVTTLIQEMTVGYTSIICDAYCGTLINTDDFQMFPHTFNISDICPQGLQGWNLIWKDKKKIQEEVLLQGLQIEGKSITLPKIIPYDK